MYAYIIFFNTVIKKQRKMMIKINVKNKQIDNKISTSELHQEILRLTTTENEHNMNNSNDSCSHKNEQR